MYSIALLCDKQDSSFFELSLMLSKQLAGKADFLCLTHIPKKDLDLDVAVFCNTPASLRPLKLRKNTVAVCDSEDKTAIDMLAKNKIPAITAGMSGFDTVTLSSITEREVTVSLLRPVTTLSGTVTEPCDFTVALTKPYSCRTVLICCATLVLLNVFPKQV